MPTDDDLLPAPPGVGWQLLLQGARTLTAAPAEVPAPVRLTAGPEAEARNEQALRDRLVALEQLESAMGPGRPGDMAGLEVASSSGAGEQQSVQLAYALACLHLLQRLHSALLRTGQSNPAAPAPGGGAGVGAPPLLGNRDLKAIHTLIHTAVVWGLTPLLEQGVGVPFAHRLYRPSAFRLPELASVGGLGATDGVDRRAHLLAHFAMALGAMLAESSDISALLRKVHVVDVYAGLCVLGFSPSFLATAPSPPASKAPTWRQGARDLLHALLDDLDTTTSLVALMALVSNAGPPPCPTWLRRVGGRYLTALLLSPGGLRCLFHVLLTASTVAPGGQPDSQQLERMAQLLLAKPASMGAEDYYAGIAGQLLACLPRADGGKWVDEQASSSNKRFAFPAAYMIVKLLNHAPGLGRRYLLDVLFSPLHRLQRWCREPGAEQLAVDLHGRPIVVREAEMSYMVDQALLLLQDTEPSDTIRRYLCGHLVPLYQALHFGHLSKSHLAGRLRLLLLILLRETEEQALLYQLTVLVQQAADLEPACRCSPGPEGGIQWVGVGGAPEPELPELEAHLDTDVAVDSTSAVTHLDFPFLIAFLRELDLPGLPGKWFLSLLDMHGVSVDSGLLTPTHHLLRVQLMLALMDAFGEGMLTELRHKLTFTKLLLESDDEEVVRGGLQYLESLLTEEQRQGRAPTSLEAEECHALLARLDTLGASQRDSGALGPLLPSVRILLLTTALASATTGEEDGAGAGTGERTAACVHGDDDGDEATTIRRIRQAITELADPVIPLRAHGMGTLKRLISTRDPALAPYVEEVTHLFLDQLEHEDSYIYLHAIKGLALMADVHGEQCLPRIAARYAAPPRGQPTTSGIATPASRTRDAMDYRLRLGEVLLLTIQRSGEVFPMIAPHVIPRVLEVLERGPEGLSRASALSLLGSIAQLSSPSVLPFLQRLVPHLSATVTFAEDVGERRGSLFAIVSLLRALGRELLDHLHLDAVRSLRRQLAYVQSRDEDLLARGHAEVALQEMDAFIQLKLALIEEVG